jgi:uncharacterized protein YjbI with pentapeptide repeats
MPKILPSKRPRLRENATLTLRISSELSRTIIDYVKTKPEPPKEKGLWNWIKANSTVVAALCTILSVVVGGIWTFNRYIEQQQLASMQQRREAIASFTGDISDPDKRNSAVYALAVLAGEDAIPLLRSQLVQDTKYGQHEDYQYAIGQALILVGEPAFSPMLELNRQASFGHATEQQMRIILATRPVIEYFLSFDQAFLKSRPKLFNGITLQNMELAQKDLTGIDFSGATFINSDFCFSNFAGDDLTSARFDNAKLGEANFSNTTIHDLRFASNNIAAKTHFDQAKVRNGDFEKSHLPESTWIGADLEDSSFMRALLEFAKFDNANLTHVSMSDAKLYNASFVGSNLNYTTFFNADLEGTDFRNADLTNTHFIFRDQDIPGLILYPQDTEDYPPRAGAFVRGANFYNAKNIDEPTRVYLCKWGGRNIPGGCNGIQVQNMSMVPEKHKMDYKFCY